MIARGRRIAGIVACVGLLVAGCGSHDASAPAGGSGANGANSSAGGDPKDTLLAALKKMDGLDTYQAEIAMPNMDIGGGQQMTTSSHIEASVKDNTVYQVTQVSGGPIGQNKQESLIRGSEYLVHSDLFSQAFGGSGSGSADTWYRAPVSAQGATMDVSMYFAPAAQAISTVSDQGTRTVQGTQVNVYRAQLDPTKFRDALSAAKLPGGIPLDKIPAPSNVDYGVGADGYVHTIGFTMGSSAPPLTIQLHDYNTPLNLPNPTNVADMPDVPGMPK